MPETANLSFCIDPKIKSGAEQLFSQFGITVPEAISIFLHTSLMVGGLPFDVKFPRFNAETEAAIIEARGIASGEIPAKGYASAQELFAELDAEC